MGDERDGGAGDDQVVRTDVGVVAGRRHVIRAAGPDTEPFLQGQLSQDVVGFQPGEDRWSLLLQPQGKLVALLRVSRVGDEEFLLDVAEGWGQAVIDALERFKLRTRCELELSTWEWLAYRGPASTELEAAAPIVASVQWATIPGLDVVGPGVAPDPTVRPIGWDTFEALRVEAGVAEMGTELDERTIPAAAGIVDLAVSFTKGCYTGQELVARIESRGSNTPTRLRGIVVESGEVPPVGATLDVDGDAVGSVTSAAWSTMLDRPVALAYVKRAVEPPARATLSPGGGPCEVVELPLVG